MRFRFKPASVAALDQIETALREHYDNTVEAIRASLLETAGESCSVHPTRLGCLFDQIDELIDPDEAPLLLALVMLRDARSGTPLDTRLTTD